MLRQPIRSARFLLTRSPDRTPPILCPSTGRSGSTLLWNALVAGRAASLLGDYRPGDWRRVARSQWDIAGERFEAGTVCKTHDFPYGLHVDQPLRIVFLYGPASDIVLSVLRCQRTRGPAWIEDHLRHMHASGGIEDIVDHDLLRLEEQVDAWLSLRGADVLSLNYESLWNHQGKIEEFVGFPITLPDRIERRFDDLPEETVQRVRTTYAALDLKISSLPSCQLVGRERL